MDNEIMEEFSINSLEKQTEEAKKCVEAKKEAELSAWFEKEVLPQIKDRIASGISFASIDYVSLAKQRFLKQNGFWLKFDENYITIFWGENKKVYESGYLNAVKRLELDGMKVIHPFYDFLDGKITTSDMNYLISYQNEDKTITKPVVVEKADEKPSTQTPSVHKIVDNSSLIKNLDERFSKQESILTDIRQGQILFFIVLCVTFSMLTTFGITTLHGAIKSVSNQLTDVCEKK